MADWKPVLDKTLQECVVQSYFNFDLVCAEVITKAHEADLGSAVFTAEQCRVRWSYLHLVVSIHYRYPFLFLLK